MHPMFLPENVFSFSDSKLNTARIESICKELNKARTSDEYLLIGQKAHWMLCAFYHGCTTQFEEAQVMIRCALDEAEDRIGGAA